MSYFDPKKSAGWSVANAPTEKTNTINNHKKTLSGHARAPSPPSPDAGGEQKNDSSGCAQKSMGLPRVCKQV